MATVAFRWSGLGEGEIGSLACLYWAAWHPILRLGTCFAWTSRVRATPMSWPHLDSQLALHFDVEELDGGSQKVRTRAIKDNANPVWVWRSVPTVPAYSTHIYIYIN